VWDLTTGDTLRVLRGHSSPVTHVLALDRQRALSASYDKIPRLWDLTGGDVVSVIAVDGPVTAVAMVPNSPWGVAGLASGRVFSFKYSASVGS